MKKTKTPTVKENKYRPAWVTPEILLEKRKVYLWRGAALLCAAITAIAAKALLTSNAVPAAALLPVIRNTALLLIMAFSLIISIIFKKANPGVTRSIMMMNSMAAGTLSAVLLQSLGMFPFCFGISLAVFLAICLLYLVYQAKYDPEDVDPELLKGPLPYIYIPY